eukprot:15612072-Heterocapsa_arctica.AAC.1
MEEETNDTQIFGEQTDEYYKIAENTKVEQSIGSNSDHDGKDIYPGVSSQKRVRIRAEQLFK